MCCYVSAPRSGEIFVGFGLALPRTIRAWVKQLDCVMIQNRIFVRCLVPKTLATLYMYVLQGAGVCQPCGGEIRRVSAQPPPLLGLVSGVRSCSEWPNTSCEKIKKRLSCQLQSGIKPTKSFIFHYGNQRCTTLAVVNPE